MLPWAAFAVFFVYYAVLAFRQPWGGDIHQYLATVHALYLDPWLPGNEAIAVAGRSSANFSPYLVVTALIGKALHVSPYGALQLAGLANLALYCTGIVLFFRTFSSLPRSPWPPLAFLTVSLFLRTVHFNWSSETDYLTLKTLQAYPSLFAWGLALTAFVLAERCLRRPPRALPLVGLALLIAVLILSHPLTGSWVVGIVGVQALLAAARAAWLPRGRREPAMSLRSGLPPSGLLLVATGMGIVGTFAWPYYSPLLLGRYSGGMEQAPFGAEPFAIMEATYVLALAALLLAPHVLRLRAALPAAQPGRWSFWIAGFLATYGAWAVLRVAGIGYGDRYVFFMALFAQALVADATCLACGAWIVRRKVAAPAGGRAALAASAVFLTLTGVAFARSPILRRDLRAQLAGPRALAAAPPTASAYYEEWTPLCAAIAPGEIVMMPSMISGNDVAAVTGARLVAVPHSYSVPDLPERKASIATFFSPGASDETRRRELARWRADKVLLIGPEIAVEGEMRALLGERLWRDGTRVVFGVDEPTTPGRLAPEPASR